YDANELLKTPEEERVKVLLEDRNKKYIEDSIRKYIGDKKLNENTLNDSKLVLEIWNESIKRFNRDFKNKAGYNARSKIISNTNNLVNEVQEYLKIEWEKVKKEAQKGAK